MAEKDGLYIKGLQEGDRIVFEQIFREYYPLLCNFARRYVSDKSTAEELVQDLFCKLWDRRSQLHINTSFNSYLYKSVTNYCLNYYRDLEIEKKIIINHVDNIEDLPGNSDFEQDTDLHEKINRALLELPEKRREIFELSRFEGLKYHEIAKKLNLNIKTVETQMARSLEFLRSNLKEYLKTIALIISVLTKL